MTENKVKFELNLILDNLRYKLGIGKKLSRRRLAVMASDPLVEAASQVLHDARHRAGYASTCGDCLSAAETVAFVLKNQIEIFGPTAVDGWMAARDFYGYTGPDGEHGAECAKTADHNYACTCDRAGQHVEATKFTMEWKKPDFHDTWMGQLPRR